VEVVVVVEVVEVVGVVGVVEVVEVVGARGALLLRIAGARRKPWSRRLHGVMQETKNAVHFSVHKRRLIV